MIRQTLSNAKWSAIQWLQRKRRRLRLDRLRRCAAKWSQHARANGQTRVCVYVGLPLDWNFVAGIVSRLAGHIRFAVMAVACTEEAAAAVPDCVRDSRAVVLREFAGLEDVAVDIVLTCGGGSRFFRAAKRVYAMHSLVSTHVIYLEDAFDNHDFILCAGPHHIRELSASFRARGIRRPILIPFGYPWVDELMMRDACAISGMGRRHLPRILLAPSWGPQNALKWAGEKIVGALISDYEVWVRPHVMSLKEDAAVLSRLQERFGDNPHFVMDYTGDSSKSLLEADLLISDWSGIAFEYALARLRPVLFIDGPMKVRNPNWRFVTGEPGIECTYRNRIGRVIPTTDNIANEVARLLVSMETWKEPLRKVRDELLFQPGQSLTQIGGIFEAVAGGRMLAHWVKAAGN